MEIQFKSLDPLFFRDGKPFASGEETWADSNFPPNPSVLFGALRTALATIPSQEIAFSQIANVLDKQALSIEQIYYSLDQEACLPLPMDYVENKMKGLEVRLKEKAEKRYSVQLLMLAARKAIISQNKTPYLRYIFQTPPSFDRVEHLQTGFFARDMLLTYLQEETPNVLSRKMGDYIVEEPKIGNGRNNLTRTVEESLLYRTGMQRPLDLQIGIVIKNRAGYQSSDLAGTCVRLGGEGKIAKIEKGHSADFDAALKNIKLKPGYFKMYLATPAIFHNELPNLGINAELVAACIGKPLSIGGYDMVKNEPKPMYKALPAGSVFYYKTTAPPDVIEAMQGKSVSDELPEQGYGIAYFGNFGLPAE